MPPSQQDKDILSYYDSHAEETRLLTGSNRLERARTQELLMRFLPPPPAVIYDVGGGSGVYARWLARQGYEVHLIDASPRLIEQARREENHDHPIATIATGDARQLDHPDRCADAVLLFGPLYHLTDREDRILALREARRLLRAKGIVLAVGISRFASALDGLFHGYLDDPEFAAIVAQDLIDGQHRNPKKLSHYFTTAFFHHPDQLKAEIEAAGLRHKGTLAIEGPAHLLQDFDKHWDDPDRRERLLDIARQTEADPTLLGMSAHMMGIGKTP